MKSLYFVDVDVVLERPEEERRKYPEINPLTNNYYQFHIVARYPDEIPSIAMEGVRERFQGVVEKKCRMWLEAINVVEGPNDKNYRVKLKEGGNPDYGGLNLYRVVDCFEVDNEEDLEGNPNNVADNYDFHFAVRWPDDLTNLVETNVRRVFPELGRITHNIWNERVDTVTGTDNKLYGIYLEEMRG